MKACEKHVTTVGTNAMTERRLRAKNYNLEGAAL
jgi:hypothetical protein